jgi:hypothetical protein
MNAKEELLETLKLDKKLDSVKCAYIYKFDSDDEKAHEVVLKEGYSTEDFERFLAALDFTYSHGYGTQELFGNVWFNDGTWLSRAEYDGSEWWNLMVCPEIPEICK